MKKLLKDNIKPFLLTSFIAGTCSYGLLYYRVQKNFDSHKSQMENEQQLKDTTRPQYEFFGINWGYRADAIVKDKLDSGDLVFMNFECMNCTSMKDLIKCQWNSFTKPYPHFDSIGIVYRDQDGINVLYDRFGNVVLQNYVECLCEPFWTHLSARKLKVQDPVMNKQIQKSIKQFVKDFESNSANIDSKSFLKEILLQLDILQPKIAKKVEDVMIEDLDYDYPKIFKQNISLGQRIMIRNRTNQELVTR